MKRCKNTLCGTHVWSTQEGKNRDKPISCVHCNRLKIDIERDDARLAKTTKRKDAH